MSQLIDAIDVHQPEMHKFKYYLNILNNTWIKFAIEFVFTMPFTWLATKQIRSPVNSHRQNRELLNVSFSHPYHAT